jgi:hypothetical protein
MSGILPTLQFSSVLNFKRMAKQSGIVPMQGTIANITFVRTQDGFQARLKSGLSKERVQHDAAFERTRENSDEFKNAGKGAELLRDVFILPILHCYDNRLQSRLVKAMMKVIKTDMVSIRGKRNLVSGDDTLLKGFSWNRFGAFTSVMKAPFTITIDRVAGTATVAVPPFTPDEQLIGNPEATHFKMIFSPAEIDWTAENSVADMQSTAFLPYDENLTTAISQDLSFSAGSVLPVFVTLSIRWYQQVGGNYYSLKNLKYDVASIEEVDVV